MDLNERPTSAQQLLPPSADAAATLSAFVDRALDRVCLFGEPGTGKSMAARMMMCARIPDLQWPFDAAVLNASSDGGIQNLRDKFQAVKYTGSNSEGLRVLVIEEVDRLSPDARPALKGHLDELESFSVSIPIIMTTNHQLKLDEAVIDRFEMVHWGKPTAEQILARAQAVLAANGLQMDEATIRKLIKQSDCGLRRFFKRILPQAIDKIRR